MRIGSRHLPLAALQGFEAAGRHLSMRRAAEELGVTQSAISHRVRGLEAALGVALFAPNRRRLALTPDGRRLLETVQGALGAIAATAVQLGTARFAGPLALAAPPAFGAEWLVPRLPGFLALYPDLSVTLATIPADPEPVLSRVDAAVVFEGTRYPGRRVETLARLEMFPVATRAVAARLGGDPAALRSETLIHEDGGAIWARWFAAMGAEQVAPRRAVHVPGTRDALALAAHGAGVAIADAFMGGAARDPRLVRPFGERTFPYGSYALVTAPEVGIGPAAAAFRDWILREAGAS